MNTTRLTARGRLRALLARVVACVLLVGITYASTVGSVHSHENLSPGRHTSVAEGAEGRSGVSSDSPLDNHTHGHECLICLLQQNLFNGALYKAPSVLAPPSAASALAPSAAVVYSSASNTRPSGRAPPFARG